MEISILYEDNHLLIVEKPVNIPVQQDRSQDMDLLSLLKKDLKERYKKPGNVYLGLVHRLDRPVGGVILFAKTSKAASRMSNIIREHKLERIYLAVTRGIVIEQKQKLIHYLVKDRKKNQVYAVPKTNKQAKKSILNYEAVNSQNNLSLLKVTLETGRPHQIRVQLKEAGYPIFGDQKYGFDQNKVGQQIALWAHQLSFIHPVKKERVVIQSNPPSTYPWTLWKNENEIN